MGCDIHICVQVQEPTGEWREIVWKDEPYDFDSEEKKQAIARLPYPEAPGCFDARNYNLFGILADVRNGRGFAGCEMGTGWRALAPYRGWPEDFDPETIAPNPNYPDEGPRAMGEHSETWMTLDELKAYPWDLESSLLYGVVSATEYEAMKQRGDVRPTSYAGGVSGRGIQTFTQAAYDSFTDVEREALDVGRTYVRLQWAMSARDATYDWAGKVIPWLESLAEGRPLRLVVGFDS